ncbi:MAG: hypothetical protein OEM00_13730 [Burkholderiaceae bacterium]|nr:hypothetical protein [Burkholderiaceae bacterium]
MKFRNYLFLLASAVLGLSSALAHARDAACQKSPRPQVSFVDFQSPNLAAPPELLTVKGKLSLPVRFDWRKRCFIAGKNLPAVVILHGSAGVDSRGDFYARALNAADIATLEIDMWEARGVTSLENRPSLPILTLPDVFGALALLSARPDIAADRIGVLGFSWGGVNSLAAADQLYVNQFGSGLLKFKAHVANYPVCYAFNNTETFPSPPFPDNAFAAGTRLETLTGAPVLIQIGTADDYDNGAQHCRDLVTYAKGQNPNTLVELAVYEGAYHAWDRIMIPVEAPDRFADEGSFFTTLVTPTVEIKPDVEQAYASRKRVVRFFRHKL